MSVSARQVKELRDRTGLGMMDCKRALQECDGNLDAAVDLLRKSGSLKAERKSGRIAAEGVVELARAGDGSAVALLEVNSETDFVARDEGFLTFVRDVAQVALAEQAADAEALGECSLDGRTVEEERQELVGRTGENIQLRRIARLDADGMLVCGYVHRNRLAAILRMEGGDQELGVDVCRHIVAMAPLCVDEQDMPAETLERERSVLEAQAAAAGKPPEIVSRMVEGRLRKYLAEITLTGQEFFRDADTTVGALLRERDARVLEFRRMEVGEGIEKKEEDFAEEVRKQVEGD